jgi:hypothetical protein
MSTKINDLIAFLLRKVPSAGRTQVVKFLYLADLEARKCLGKPLTNLNYKLDNHGPFDPVILTRLDDMESQGQISSEPYSYRGNRSYSYAKNKNTPKVRFSPEKEAILNHVAEIVRKNSLEKLLEIVYDTEPVVEAKKRKVSRIPLKMNLVDNENRIPGLELERVLKSMDSIEKGKCRDLDKILAELGD